MSDDTPQPGVAGLGRRILLGLGGLMVLLAGFSVLSSVPTAVRPCLN